MTPTAPPKSEPSALALAYKLDAAVLSYWSRRPVRRGEPVFASSRHRAQVRLLEQPPAGRAA